MSGAAKYLSKADILRVDDRPTADVDVPEWGGVVRIMAPTSWELSEFQGSQITVSVDDGKPSSKIDIVGADAKLAALCIVDDDGNRMFTGKEVRELGRKSSKALDRVVAKIRELDGMGDALEAIEGNSD